VFAKPIHAEMTPEPVRVSPAPAGPDWRSEPVMTYGWSRPITMSFRISSFDSFHGLNVTTLSSLAVIIRTHVDWSGMSVETSGRPLQALGGSISQPTGRPGYWQLGPFHAPKHEHAPFS